MQFNPGFRLSIIDLIVLLLGISSAIVFYNIMPIASFVLIFVVGHFFLFCNVVRMSRLPELIWASSFLLLAISAFIYNNPSWLIVALASLSLSALLVFLEIRKPGYHGVFWQKINPNLKQWFSNKNNL
jgi:hypothetical protein